MDNNNSLHSEYKDLADILRDLTPYNPNAKTTDTTPKDATNKTTEDATNKIIDDNEQKALLDILNNISQQEVAKQLSKEHDALNALQDEVIMLRKEIQTKTMHNAQKKGQRKKQRKKRSKRRRQDSNREHIHTSSESQKGQHGEDYGDQQPNASHMDSLNDISEEEESEIQRQEDDDDMLVSIQRQMDIFQMEMQQEVTRRLQQFAISRKQKRKRSSHNVAKTNSRGKLPIPADLQKQMQMDRVKDINKESNNGIHHVQTKQKRKRNKRKRNSGRERYTTPALQMQRQMQQAKLRSMRDFDNHNERQSSVSTTTKQDALRSYSPTVDYFADEEPHTSEAESDTSDTDLTHTATSTQQQTRQITVIVHHHPYQQPCDHINNPMATCPSSTCHVATSDQRMQQLYNDMSRIRQKSGHVLPYVLQAVKGHNIVNIRPQSKLDVYSDDSMPIMHVYTLSTNTPYKPKVGHFNPSPIKKATNGGQPSPWTNTPHHHYSDTDISINIGKNAQKTSSKHAEANTTMMSSNMSFAISTEGTSIQMPEKPSLLRLPDDDSIATFRKAYNEHVDAIDDFNQEHNTNIRVSLKALVVRKVRKLISRRYLLPRHQTHDGSINEPEVKNYILRKGDYKDTGRDTPYIRDPIQKLRDIKWEETHPKHEQRLAKYIIKWDQALEDLGDNLIQPKTLADIMLKAVKPKTLKDKIINRIGTGRPPDGSDDVKQKWRQEARKNVNHMYNLILENAKYQDKQQAINPRHPQQRSQLKITGLIPKPNEICNNYKKGRCRFGSNCNRMHQNDDGTIAQTRANANNPTRNDDSESSTETDTAETETKQTSRDQRAACFQWLAGNCTRGSSCYFKHDPDEFNTDKRPLAKERERKKALNTPPRRSTSGGGSRQPQNSQPASTTNATTAVKCAICGGPHDFYTACPKRNKVARILQAANIGYSHTARYWQNAKNIQTVMQWRAANPKQFMQQSPQNGRTLRYTGIYMAFGTKYATDIDLGGDYNIAPEADFDKIIQKHKNGELKGWRIQILKKTRVVELANGDFVTIDKWIRTKLTGESIASRHVTVYDTEFGFAQAWTGRIIVGRHTAQQFGFKDPQRQWLDAQMGPTTIPPTHKTPDNDDDSEHAEVEDVTDDYTQQTTTNANAQHLLPRQKQSTTTPKISAKQFMAKSTTTEPATAKPRSRNITAVGTTYVGQHAFKHGDSCTWVNDPMLKYSYITTAALTRSAAPKNKNKGVYASSSKNTKTNSSRPITAKERTPTMINEATAAEWMLSRPKAKQKHMIKQGIGIATTFDNNDMSPTICELQQPQHKDMADWIYGSHKQQAQGITVTTIPVTRVLQRRQKIAVINNQSFIVVPSNECKVILGRKAMQQVQASRDTDPSPLRQSTPLQQQQEVDECIQSALDEVKIYIPEITSAQQQRLHDMVLKAKTNIWRSKYALDEPANAHPMQIKLKPGAKPPSGRLPRRNFTAGQHDFLKAHLKMLVDMKVISRHEGPWACPIVLVLKPDQTWRL